jgi:ankyrin repeat protein
MGYVPITRALIQGGARKEIKNLNKLSPLDIALELHSDTLLTILSGISSAQANRWSPKSLKNPDTLDRDQAMILAAISGDELQLKRLLSEGADIQYRDSDGFRAIDRARDTGKKTIVKLLEEAESAY